MTKLGLMFLYCTLQLMYLANGFPGFISLRDTAHPTKKIRPKRLQYLERFRELPGHVALIYKL